MEAAEATRGAVAASQELFRRGVGALDSRVRSETDKTSGHLNSLEKDFGTLTNQVAALNRPPARSVHTLSSQSRAKASANTRNEATKPAWVPY